MLEKVVGQKETKLMAAVLFCNDLVTGNQLGPTDT